MTTLITLLIIALVIVTALYYPSWRRRWILRRPFPPAYLTILKRRLPFYEKLSPDEQQQLLDLVRLFLADKTFYGCNGLTISDEIRVTIAAEASAAQPSDWYLSAAETHPGLSGCLSGPKTAAKRGRYHQ